MSDVTFRRKSIHLNNPVRVFYKLPADSHKDEFHRYDHVVSPAVWAERQHTTVEPIKTPLPPHIHLQSMLVRDTVSDDVVFRFQHLGGGGAWVGSFDDLLDSTFAISEVRRATLSLNTVLPMSGHRKKTWTFLTEDGAPSSPYAALEGVDLTANAHADNQNTNEEGVFLSQAALEKLRQDQLAKLGASRRLLEQRRLEGEFDSSPAAFDRSALASFAVPAARRLFGQPTSTNPLFVVKPLQLHTYIVRVAGADWAESTVGAMVGVGAAQSTVGALAGQPATPLKQIDTKVAKVVDTVSNTFDIIKRGANEVIDAARGVAHNERAPPATEANSRVSDGLAGIAGQPPPAQPEYSRHPSVDNVLHGHEHTVIPGRTREAWRLIPSRWEYIVVLLASLAGVAFFMQALRVLSRGAAVSQENNRRGKDV